MDYNSDTLIPYIPASEYDAVAEEFLERYYPEALKKPAPVPIMDVAINNVGLDLKEVCLSEELDIYGMTIFSDGSVEVYDPVEGLYDTRVFKKKTILIDPEAVKRTNIGCRNNTIAHECVHWFKHRLYFMMQKYTLPRNAKYCKCRVDQLSYLTEEEGILENQAIGIAPRILMPKKTFTEAALEIGIRHGGDNWRSICELADFFDVSKQSVKIRLEECNLV